MTYGAVAQPSACVRLIPHGGDGGLLVPNPNHPFLLFLSELLLSFLKPVKSVPVAIGFGQKKCSQLLYVLEEEEEEGQEGSCPLCQPMAPSSWLRNPLQRTWGRGISKLMGEA